MGAQAIVLITSNLGLVLQPAAMSQAPEPGCSNCCGLCGDNCHCQKGVSGVLIGAFIVVAAGVFTFFTTFIDIFPWQWYRDLCLFWFLLGCFIFVCGWLHIIICGCDVNEQRALQAAAAAKAREVDEENAVSAPTPYIMITG